METLVVLASPTAPSTGLYDRMIPVMSYRGLTDETLALVGFTLLASHDPGLFIGLAQSQMFRLEGTASPHDSASRVDRAATFLAVYEAAIRRAGCALFSRGQAKQALDELIPVVYQELHRLARRYMIRERAGQRLALAGAHLGDGAAVQHHAADQLDVEMALAEGALGGLAS